jgi:uncharacterized iron-regulated protein
LSVLERHLEKGDRVVFEMISKKQQPVIEQYLTGNISTEELPKALDWKKSGWPDWKFYGPLFNVARDKGAHIQYGTLPRKELSERFPITELPNQQLLDLLKVDIVEGHCNLLPEKAISPITKVQIRKDKFLAEQMVQADSTARSFLIAGNGHVMKDRAVPQYFSSMQLKGTLVVGMNEAGNSSDVDALYNAYDILWTTAGIGKTQEDYCQQLRKKFGK